MIDGTLWTVSTSGLMASDPGNATQRAWVPFDTRPSSPEGAAGTHGRSVPAAPFSVTPFV